MTDAKPLLFALDESGQRREVAAEPARVLCGDMRELLAAMPPESVDAVVTDPPYGLEFMGKAWDQQVPGPDYWREVLRVCKPGAHMVAFGGTRTAHRLACAIEDAGWEIRDCLSWLYGSGFPKSHDISKAIDREAGAQREIIGTHKAPGYALSNVAQGECVRTRYQFDKTGAPVTDAARAWDGWGTALKPAWEPAYLCRKPFKGSVASCVCEHGCGALNIDRCRVGTSGATKDVATGDGVKPNRVYGTYGACKTAPIALGRWPANLVLDEEAARLLDASVGDLGISQGGSRGAGGQHGSYGAIAAMPYVKPGFGDSGGPSRFYYTAKASRSEREAGLERFAAVAGGDVTGRAPGSAGAVASAYAGTTQTERRNTHPTVKPVSLMRWLVRLITPPGGIVLDPFTGSGSTGVAAVLEGARFVGCELSVEYAKLAAARIAHAADEDDDQLTLFERSELKPPVKVRPSQAAFLWTEDDEASP